MTPKPKNARKQDVKTPKLAKSTNAVAATAPKPNWPPLNPLIPAADLTLNTLLDSQILTIPRLWSSTLCQKYTTFLSTLPLTTTPGKPKRGEAVRVNDRFQVDDSDFAERLWSGTGLKSIVENPILGEKKLSAAERRELWGGDVLGLNSNIRVYRYSRGQYFDQHYDDSNNIMFPTSGSPEAVAAKTTWTLLLYLSSPTTGCKGGETVFYPEPLNKREPVPPPVVAEMEVGMALLHRHGKDCLLHEGREVTEGEKWIIRSDLCVKR